MMPAIGLQKTLPFVISVLSNSVGAEPSCWVGPMKNMEWACCYTKQPECWDGDFTYERCCLGFQRPGDAACWPDGSDYDFCCLKYERWHPDPGCFDSHYTFHRCCGGHVAILWFSIRKRVASLYKYWLEWYGPWVPLLLLSLCLRILAWISDGAITYRSVAQRSVVVPAASQLRVISTYMLLAWHCLGRCGGDARKCTTEWQENEQPKQFLDCFLVIHTDVFFVLTSYIACASTYDKHPTSDRRLANLFDAVLSVAAAVLRRTARLVPMILIGGAMHAEGYESLYATLSNNRPGAFLGVHSPGRDPRTWPFGVELLCLVVLQIILASIFVFGEILGLLLAFAILAFCLKRRVDGGIGNYAADPISHESWLAGHLALFAHRLPLTLTTLLIARLLRRIPINIGEPSNEACQGNALELVAKSEETREASREHILTETATVEAINSSTKRNMDNISDASACRASDGTYHVKDLLTSLGYSQYIDSFLKCGFDEIDILRDMSEEHMKLCGVAPSDVAKIRAGLKIGQYDTRSSCRISFSLSAVIAAASSYHREHSCSDLYLIAAWVLAAAGIFISASLEWLWLYGPRIIFPIWASPFPIKLPLVLGCVGLLEVSMRTSIGRKRSATGLLAWLERRSMGVLFFSDSVENSLLVRLPAHAFNVSMFFFQLPALIFCVNVVVSLLVFIESPFRSLLESLIARGIDYVQAESKSNPIVRFAAGVMVLMVCIAISFVVNEVCSEPFPSPCLL